MASLLTDPLFETSGVGRPPNKNFYHFTVTKSDVIWRWWKISLRAVDRYTKPGELRESHQDFLDDTWLQGEVSAVFGPQILVYIKALCQGHYDYLEHLSDSLLLRIINYLELEDVEQLRQTSHHFRLLCGSEMFWEQAVRRCCNTVSDELVSLALEMGWRNIFFTNKLQLQKLISRRRLQTEEQHEGQVSARERNVDRSHEESSEQTQTSHSEQESYHPGIIPDMSRSTSTGTGFDNSSFCSDIDPGSNSEAEASSDFTKPAPDQFLDDINLLSGKNPSAALNYVRGDWRRKTNKRH